MKQLTTKKGLLAFALTVLAAGAALATTDTTFDNINTTLTGYLQGSLGKLFVVSSLIGGTAGAAVSGKLWYLATGLGLGLAAYYGPSLLTTTFALTF